jgi:hypothetical protein
MDMHRLEKLLSHSGLDGYRLTMELLQETADPDAYLAADEAIDHEHALVRATAARLRTDTDGPVEYARAAYEFVRDTIPHSADSCRLRCGRHPMARRSNRYISQPRQ